MTEGKQMPDIKLTREEKIFLLKTARNSIRSVLTGTACSTGELTATENLEKEFGVFVTIKKNGVLRGCIGHMQGKYPLKEEVERLARSSAFEDPRFPSVTLEELDSLELEISVLTPLHSIQSLDDIQIGVHGIHIRKGLRSAVFLPQVAVEQGWDRKTFLSQCCRKASLAPDTWKDPSCEIMIFHTIVFGESS